LNNPCSIEYIFLWQLQHQTFLIYLHLNSSDFLLGQFTTLSSVVTLKFGIRTLQGFTQGYLFIWVYLLSWNNSYNSILSTTPMFILSLGLSSYFCSPGQAQRSGIWAGPVFRRPCVCFGALCSPSWNSQWLLNTDPSFPFFTWTSEICSCPCL
jgi:hypothetical protein